MIVVDIGHTFLALEHRPENRLEYFRIQITALTPSRQPIFLPSAYVRPLYEIPHSKMRSPLLANLAVISGSKPNLFSSIFID